MDHRRVDPATFVPWSTTRRARDAACNRAFAVAHLLHGVRPGSFQMRPLATPFGGCSLQRMTTFENVAGQCRRSRAICTIAVLGMLAACSSTTSDHKCVVALSDKIDCPGPSKTPWSAIPALRRGAELRRRCRCDGFWSTSGHDERNLTCYYTTLPRTRSSVRRCAEFRRSSSPTCTCATAGACFVPMATSRPFVPGTAAAPRGSLEPRPGSRSRRRQRLGTGAISTSSQPVLQ